MKKTFVLVANPEAPRTVSGDGMHNSAGHGICRNKPAVLKVGDPTGRCDPNSRTIVLEQRPDGVIRQSISLAVNRNLPVLPSVQTIERAKPDTAVPSRQNGPNESTGQTLFDRNRGHGIVAEAVEAIRGRYPNIAFTILKEGQNEIT